MPLLSGYTRCFTSVSARCKDRNSARRVLLLLSPRVTLEMWNGLPLASFSQSVNYKIEPLIIGSTLPIHIEYKERLLILVNNYDITLYNIATVHFPRFFPANTTRHDSHCPRYFHYSIPVSFYLETTSFLDLMECVLLNRFILKFICFHLQIRNYVLPINIVYHLSISRLLSLNCLNLPRYRFGMLLQWKMSALISSRHLLDEVSVGYYISIFL